MSKFFTRYAPPAVAGERFSSDDTSCRSRTRQEFLHESLTSTIMERFAKTGVLVPPGMNRRVPLFEDMTQIPDNVNEAFALVQRVKSDFASLPSGVRDRFNNNPLELYAFLGDARNRDEAISLGLIAKSTKVAKIDPSPAGDKGGEAAVADNPETK